MEIRKVEALLFAFGKPIAFTKLAQLLSVKPDDAKQAVLALQQEYQSQQSGMSIVMTGRECQMVTAPLYADVVSTAIDAEQGAELTRPSLEALTVIAYRGPITKHELEQIRGVNCALILRNLLIRGLIEERYDATLGLAVYSVTTDFLSYIGLGAVEDLPRYQELSHHQDIEDFLAQQNS